MSSPGALGSLVVSLEANIAQFESAMKRAEYVADQMSRGVTAKIRAVDAAMVGFATAGAEAAIRGIADAFESLGPAAIAAAAHLERMRQVVGGTVENLSAITAVAKLSDTSIESLQTGMTKLAKSMASSGDETKGAGAAFTALGVNARDAAGKLRPTDEVMIEISKRLDGFADGAGKAAVMQQLFGKAGAQLLPVMHDMAIAGELVGKVTGEQARQAEEYEKTIVRLTASKQGLVRTVALEVVPVLTALGQAMLEAQGHAGGLRDQVNGLAKDGSIRGWAEQTATFIAQTVDWFRILGATLSAIGSSFEVVGADIKVAIATAFNPLGLKSALEDRNRILEAANKKWSDLQYLNLHATEDAVRKQIDVMRLLEKYAGGQYMDARDFQAGNKPGLNFSTGGKVPQASNDLNDVLNKILGHESGFAKDYAKDMATLTQAFMTGQISAGRFGDAVNALIRQQPGFQAAIKRTTELEDYAAKRTAEQVKAYAEALAVGDEIIASMDDQARGMQAEIDTIGMSAAERDKYNITLKLSLDLKRALSDPNLKEEDAANIEAQIRARAAELTQLVDTRAELQNQRSVWDQLSTGAGQFFADMVEHGASAFKRLGEQLKRFALDLVALFAKRWVLQMVAGLTGSSALAASAGQVGQGTVAGSFMNGGLLPSGFLGQAFSSGATSLATTLGVENIGMLASIGEVAAFIPVIGTAIAAITMLYQVFKDKGENWQATLGFGANAHAYTSSGPFGAEGFSSIQGNDAINRQIQAFFASTSGIDRSLASGLTADQIARIQGNLGGAYTSRNNGQPAQFAFGRDDSTAAQQLTLEYLQKKYGTIFDEIDKTFADFIRNYTGSSSDLLTQIGQFASVMQALGTTAIPGLNIESLRAMQREGEKLDETFKSVTASWSTYVDLFYSDAEKQTMGMDLLRHQFEALGLQMPQTREEFRHLVESVDRNSPLWRSLVELAPAFANLVPAVNAVHAATTEWGNTLARVGNFAFPYGHVPNATDQPGSNMPTQDVINAWQSAQQTAQALEAATRQLAQYVDSLLTNAQLSPLAPNEQLAAAATDWQNTLGLARSGDVAAMNHLAQASDVYLRLARAFFGSSSDYVDIFHRVFNADAGLAHVADYNTRMETLSTDLLSTTRQIPLALSQIRDILIDLRDNLPTVADAAHAAGDQVSDAIRNAGLATSRR